FRLSFFFFSSRRRHTRSKRDWSSDVCSSDLIDEVVESIRVLNSQGISATVDNLGEFVFEKSEALAAKDQILNVIEAIHEHELDRSEERRVGKECTAGGAESL